MKKVVAKSNIILPKTELSNHEKKLQMETQHVLQWLKGLKHKRIF
jgi:hypothetical protein